MIGVTLILCSRSRYMNVDLKLNVSRIKGAEVV